MDFENKPALYEQAKKALIKFKDCFSISSSSNIEGKPFSQFKREKSWNRQGKDRQRHVKTYGFARKKNQSIRCRWENPKMPILRIISFLGGDVPRCPSYGLYISQLIRFARVCSNVDDFNNRNLFLTAKLLKQGYRYHKIRKAFSKFYHRHSELIVEYNIGLKTLLQQCISEPILYGDLVYKFKRNVGKPNFSDQFKKIVKRYIRVGYNLDIMPQSACLVLNPITVYSYGFLFNCTTVGQASDSMTALT